ncbi:hypothetical protein ACFWZ2_38755 [Streptomyces sp. NPDC059002]|uniref:COG4315 family predicted lipoprotein n=1 Tax=Streptomyces sp. NPDC059002 TaxID=3346690 RepID=UPI00369C618F
MNARTTRTRRTFVSAGIAVATAAAAIGLSACGSSNDTKNDSSASATPSASAPSGSPSATETAQGSTVKVSEADGKKILTDGEGRTLYLFTKDSAGKSACEGQCLTVWPVLKAPAEAGDGVDKGKLGTTETNGVQQVTYDSKPLYYFKDDKAAGDTKGQGVQGVWYLVAPDGQAIK